MKVTASYIFTAVLLAQAVSAMPRPMPEPEPDFMEIDLDYSGFDDHGSLAARNFITKTIGKVAHKATESIAHKLQTHSDPTNQNQESAGTHAEHHENHEGHHGALGPRGFDYESFEGEMGLQRRANVGAEIRDFFENVIGGLKGIVLISKNLKGELEHEKKKLGTQANDKKEKKHGEHEEKKHKDGEHQPKENDGGDGAAGEGAKDDKKEDKHAHAHAHAHGNAQGHEHKEHDDKHKKADGDKAPADGDNADSTDGGPAVERRDMYTDFGYYGVDFEDSQLYRRGYDDGMYAEYVEPALYRRDFMDIDQGIYGIDNEGYYYY